MIENPFLSKSWYLTLLVGVFLLGIGSVTYAQGPPENPGNGQVTDPVIDNVQLAATSACAGSKFEFSFAVTNGNDQDLEFFTTETTYFVKLQYRDELDTIIPVDSLYFQSENFPADSNFASATIADNITIPEYAPASADYELVVTSINPNPYSEAISVTNFEIRNENRWTGALSSVWNEKGNWECDLVPTKYSDVIVPSTPSGGTNFPILKAVGFAGNILIEPKASVKIEEGILNVSGMITNGGTLDGQNGSLQFIGASAQVLPADCLLNNRIKNLSVNNSAGLTLSGPVEVTGTVLVAVGNLTSNGNLKLISDAIQTALIDGSGRGEVLGEVTMLRFLDNGFGYKYFGTPFSNTTVGDFSLFMDLLDPATSFPHFYEYLEHREDENGNDLTGWQAFTQTHYKLNIGVGYALNLSNVTAPVTIEITGEVNNSSVDFSLQNSNGLYSNGFNLVGNPYPSPIDWNTIVPTLSGIDNAIYFFTAGSENRYTGTYTSYVNGISTDGRSSNIIPSMQGFFVRVSDPADNVYPVTGTLSFTNAARTGNQVNQAFYKSKNNPEKPQIKLTSGFKNKKASDAVVIYFNKEATPEFEKDFDALKLLNTAAEVPSVYSLTRTEQKLSINAVSSANNQELPLGIKTERSGEMYIKLANVENIFPSGQIYIMDRQTKVVHNLSENPIYSFAFQKGENNKRFVLILSSEKLSAVEMDRIKEPFSVYSERGEIVLKLNLPANSFGNITLSNISGRLLQKKTGKEKEEIRFDGVTTSGIYMVTLELKNERITKKILFKNRE